MMKFALFLVCSLVAVQGFQANPAKSSDVRSIGEIIGEIQDILAQIRQVVNELQNELPQIIQGIRDSVREIIEQAEDIASEIRERIRDIVQTAGEIGISCIGAQEDEINALGEFASEGIRACATDALNQIEPLSNQINNLVTEANALRDDIVARTLQCIEDNNSLTAILCLTKQIAPIRFQLQQLQEQVRETVVLVRETVLQVPANLANCVLNVHTEVARREKVILENVAQCIVDSVASDENEN